MSRNRRRRNMQMAVMKSNNLTADELKLFGFETVCPKCGETDPNKFSNDSSNKNGKQTYCKKCVKKKSISVEEAVMRAEAYIKQKETNAVPAQ